MPTAGTSEFWDEVENATSENLELAGIVRLLEQAAGSRPAFDWEADSVQSAQILEDVASRDAKSVALTARVEGLESARVGDEHTLIAVTDDPERLYKATHSDVFGCRSFFSPHDPDLEGKHFHPTGCGDPTFYLRRWMILNFITGLETRFEGFLPPEDGLRLPRICVSQPALMGSNPSRRQIREALREYGFEQISEDAFLDNDGILLTDAAPRNVWIVEGIPVPFDVIAEVANPRVLQWAGK